MQIHNPTKNAIKVQIKGTEYAIESEGTLNNIPEVDARYWQENLHKFLILRKDKIDVEVAPEVVEIPSPKMEEVIQTTVEQVAEEVKLPEETIVEEQGEIIKDEVISEVTKVEKKSKKVK